MKKALLIAFAVLLLAGSISAAPYGRSYIGLYASETLYADDTLYVDNHSVCDWFYPAYSAFELWIWILPSTRGVQAFEFKMQYPASSSIYQGPLIQNPHITVANGSPAAGVIGTYDGCQLNWTWCYHQEITSRNTTVRNFSIVPHPLTGLIQAAGCDENFTLEPLYPLTKMYLYSPCIIGTKEASWGAIKSLF